MTIGVMGKWTISWIEATLIQTVIILMIFLVSNNNHMAFGSAAIRLRQQQQQQQLQQQQLRLASYSSTTATTTIRMPPTTTSVEIEIEPFTISTLPPVSVTTARPSSVVVPSRNLNRNRYQSFYQYQSQSSIRDRDRPKYQYTNYANRTNSSPNSKYSGYQSLNQPSLFQTSTRRPSFLNSYPNPLRIGPGGSKTVGRKSVLCCTDQLFKATCAHFKHCFWYNNPGRKCFSKVRGKC